MPAESKSQRKAFGMALAARRGEIPSDKLYGAARKLYKDKTLSEEQLSEYATTKERKLPKKVGLRGHRVRAKV